MDNYYKSYSSWGISSGDAVGVLGSVSRSNASAGEAGSSGSGSRRSSSNMGSVVSVSNNNNNRKKNGTSSLSSRLIRGLSTIVRRGTILGAVVGGVWMYYEYKTTIKVLLDNDKNKKKNSIRSKKNGNGNGSNSSDSTDNEKKKKVLVIEFDNIKFVDKFVESRSSCGGSSTDQRYEMEKKEFINTIHHAASDPSIVGLYGIFDGRNNGSTINSLGWGDLEEIRTSLRVFRESHRIHNEPNISHKLRVIPSVESKFMYAYANQYDTAGNCSGNKLYYLASIFTHIHMQQYGSLNLFGMMLQTTFLRNFFEKYGIHVHTLSAGRYKAAPNTFTHTKYNKHDKEQMMSLVNNIDHDICDEITASRSKHLLFNTWLSNHMIKKHTKKSSNNNNASGNGASGHSANNNALVEEMWKKIYNVGSFTANDAWKYGFIDYVSRRDPFHDLLKSNSHDNKEYIKSLWDRHETDFDRYNATETITIKEYAEHIQKLRKAKRRIKEIKAYITEIVHFTKKLTTFIKEQLVKVGVFDVHDESTSTTSSSSGSTSTRTSSTKKNDMLKEEIALITFDGDLTSTSANTLIHQIHQIQKRNNDNINNPDTKTKCIVLRVNCPGGDFHAGEAVLQQLNAACISNHKGTTTTKETNKAIPLIVSFGNVAASGGYYISTHADRIFANKKTITGSIGVFAMKFDFTGLAQKYGISFDDVSSNNSQLAGFSSPLKPMTQKCKHILNQQVDTCYDRFKHVVYTGRNRIHQEQNNMHHNANASHVNTNDDTTTITEIDSIDNVNVNDHVISMEYVDSKLANGRVFTGLQAKHNGLIDEIGGLHRAIAYAKRTYCTKNKNKNDIKQQTASGSGGGAADGTDSHDSDEYSHVEIMEYPNKNSLLYSYVNDDDSDENIYGGAFLKTIISELFQLRTSRWQQQQQQQQHQQQQQSLTGMNDINNNTAMMMMKKLLVSNPNPADAFSLSPLVLNAIIASQMNNNSDNGNGSSSTSINGHNIFMTLDENTALQCLLLDYNQKNNQNNNKNNSKDW